MKMVNKTIITFLCLIYSCFTQATINPFTTLLEADKTIHQDLLVKENDSVKLNIGTIDCLAIDATVHQLADDSFVRIILEDKEGNCYQILECDKIKFHKDIVFFNKYCEETAYIGNTKSVAIKFYVHNALLHIKDIFYAETSSSLSDRRTIELEKEKQNVIYRQKIDIVDRINSYNTLHNKIWSADVTDLAPEPFNTKKRILNISDSTNTHCIEYYRSGIFDFGDTPLQYSNNSNRGNDFVHYFDWRNRHGKNWMTSCKHQGDSGYCWAFSVVGATEALVNLYYNRLLNLDLSEEDVGYYTYSNNSGYSGGSIFSALSYVKNHGVIDEVSLPFVDSHETWLPTVRTSSYQECISIDNYFLVSHSNPDSTKLNRIKKAIIANGPLVSGFQWEPSNILKRHAMALVGFGTIQEGDSVTYYSQNDGRSVYVIPHGSPYIGKDYWIFKNSYSANDGHGHDGYMYILFKDLWCLIETYKISPPITSINYSDNDICITDDDGDGFFFWGIGPKPSNCPSWVPDEPDGDDSDYSKGPINEFGFLRSLDPNLNDVISITQDSISVKQKYMYQHTSIQNGSTLTLRGRTTFYKDVVLTVKNGGTLIVNNTTVNNANIDVEPGGCVKIINNGQINICHNGIFNIPLGATLDITTGSINSN